MVGTGGSRRPHTWACTRLVARSAIVVSSAIVVRSAIVVSSVVVALALTLTGCEGAQQVVVPDGYRPVGDGRLVGLQARMGTLDQVARAEVVDQSPEAVVVRLTLQLGDQPSRLRLTRETILVLAAPLAGRPVRDVGGATLPLVSAVPSPSAPPPPA